MRQPLGVGFRKLKDRKERLIAHIAARARCDTVYGGAAAQVFADKLAAMKGGTDLRDIVGDVYSASTGRWHPKHEAFECPECGSVHLGKENAYQCCQSGADQELLDQLNEGIENE